MRHQAGSIRNTLRTAAGIMALLLILPALLSPCPMAVAEEWAESEELVQDSMNWVETIQAQYDYRALGVAKGTKYPVYAAPYPDAWRGKNGRAAVSVNEPFTLLGTADHGNWLWVYYQIDKVSGRVGWVYAPEAANEIFDVFPYENKLLIIQDDAVAVTDDPFGSRRVIATLHAGDQVIGLADVENPGAEGEYWAYIELEINGQPAWGFIRDARVSQPELYYIEGQTLVIREGVTRIGSLPATYDDDWEEIMEKDFNQIRGDIAIEYGPELWGIQEISFPSTLRIIGEYAFEIGHLKEFRVPDTVEKIVGTVFYGVEIDRFVLSGGFVGDIDPWMLADHASAAEFAVEEGNPRYVSRDGVLFTADIKTLILYPARKADTHYDVPRGVEIIGDLAFDDDEMNNPLQTVSLPIGLREIGAWAFGGCGRLNSISIPLTVTRVDRTAFLHCVCLERVSAPQGIEIVLPSDDSWAEAVDRTYYMGDNGYTGWTGGDEVNWIGGYGWVVAADGEDAVPAYESAVSMEIAQYIPSGTYEYSSYYSEKGEKADRINVGGYYDPSWINLDCFLPDPGSVFFVVTDADFAPGVFVSELGNLADRADYRFNGLGYGSLDALFYRYELVTDEEGWTDFVFEDVAVPLRACTLYRAGGKGTDVYGLLIADHELDEIWLRDAVSGEGTIRLFSTFQCRVLEESGDWLRVQTAMGEGWIPRENFQEVYPKE